MGLLDLTGERMVVALGAVDAGAVDERGDSLGDRLMVVAPLVEKPRRPLVVCARRSGDEDLADDAVPGAVGAEGMLEIRPPAAAPAALLARFPFSPPHQEHIPQLAHPHGMLVGIEEPIDQRRAPRFGWTRGLEKVALLGRGRDPSGQIEPHASAPSGIVDRRSRLHALPRPRLRHQHVDRLGHRREGSRFRRLPGGASGGLSSGALQGGDPGPDDALLVVGELFVGGHVRLGPLREIHEQRAQVRLPREHDRTAIPPGKHGGRGVELQAAMLLDRPVALHAVPIEEGLHPRRPERRRIGRRGPAGDQ